MRAAGGAEEAKITGFDKALERAQLETIAEHTHLDAGFSIDMRDLEIRGAGELLGTHQHGQIAAAGFHLYTRLLAEAARRLRIGERPQAQTDAEKEGDSPRQPLSIFQPQSVLRSQLSIELPIPISIRADYVPDKNVHLLLYRRIADLTTPADRPP